MGRKTRKSTHTSVANAGSTVAGARPRNVRNFGDGSRRATWRWGIVFLLSGIIAFSSALAAPFVFDDLPAIDHNPSIRHLIPISAALQPPRDTPVAGRPVVNVTLAFNYAINDLIGIEQEPPRMDPRRTIGYHILNVLIHCLNGLLLFGVLRRTIRRFENSGLDPERTAGLATLLWLLHPIQTEAVDYTIQRTELIVSTFYVLTLYCAIRAWKSPDREHRRNWWAIGAVIACAAGMASKEVMLTAPIMVVLYDRAFLQSSWRSLIGDRSRRLLYVSLFATSAIVLLYVAMGARSHSVGLHLGVSWHEYLYTQGWAITRYLRLLMWPSGLTFDYGDTPVGGLKALLGAIVLVSLLGAIAAAWRRPAWRWLAFAGAWFFLILVPSSSVIPIKTEIAAERRVYLASAGVFVAVVVAVEFLRRRMKIGITMPYRAVVFVGVVLGVCTFGRGLIFQSEESLYRDVVAKAPANPRGYVGVGLAIAERGPTKLPEAATWFRQAIAVDSNSFLAWQSLGIVSVFGGRWSDAVHAFREVFRLDPGNLDAAAGMARAEVHLGEPDSAARYIARIGNADPEALSMLGEELLSMHRTRDALPYLERSISAMPSGRGAALLAVGDAEVGDTTGAVQAAKLALESGGTSSDTYVIAAHAMRLIHHTSDAKAFLTRALELDSSSVAARAELDSLKTR